MTTYGSATVGAPAAGLAVTGDHIAALITLAGGLIFMAAAFFRASLRRRPIRP